METKKALVVLIGILIFLITSAKANHNFWQVGTGAAYFDDVIVTPEPTTLLLFGLGGLALRDTGHNSFGC